MRNFDFAPLSRSSIGFDHLFDLLNNPQLSEDQGGYPPYDIVRTGPDTYRIAIAIAGFTPDEVTVITQQNLLTVRFNLEDHVEVEQANYENGLLQIDLVRKIPEAMKPRKIAIGTGNPSSKPMKSLNAA